MDIESYMLKISDLTNIKKYTSFQKECINTWFNVWNLSFDDVALAFKGTIDIYNKRDMFIPIYSGQCWESRFFRLWNAFLKGVKEEKDVRR